MVNRKTPSDSTLAAHILYELRTTRYSGSYVEVTEDDLMALGAGLNFHPKRMFNIIDLLSGAGCSVLPSQPCHSEHGILKRFIVGLNGTDPKSVSRFQVFPGKWNNPFIEPLQSFFGVYLAELPPNTEGAAAEARFAGMWIKSVSIDWHPTPYLFSGEEETVNVFEQDHLFTSKGLLLPSVFDVGCTFFKPNSSGDGQAGTRSSSYHSLTVIAIRGDVRLLEQKKLPYATLALLMDQPKKTNNT